MSALQTAVAGLQANSTAISIASSNISNSGTTAYKASDTSFETLLAGAIGTNNTNSSSVTANATQNISEQGTLTATSSDTDLAISGDGFFVVSTSATDTSEVEYTRAGDFTTDSNGNLVNSSGEYLLGYETDADGNVSSSASLSYINVSDLAGSATATTTASLTGNLESSTEADTTYATGDVAAGTTTADASTSVDIYDSQGGTKAFTTSYVKTSANTWSYEISYTGDSTDLTTGTDLIDTGTITFNTDGSLESVTSASAGTSTDGTIALSLSWDQTASGLTTQDVTFDFGSLDGTDGLTQYDTASTTTSSVDGAVYGDVTGTSIAEDGTVSATYSNGQSKDVYKIALATFANENGLEAVSGNAYIATTSSGAASLHEAGTGGSGTIKSSELESSTVDVATELTDLITIQRAYSACAKVVTTSTNMMDSLLQAVS